MSRVEPRRWSIDDEGPYLPLTPKWKYICCKCDKLNISPVSTEIYGECTKCDHERCRECKIKWGEDQPLWLLRIVREDEHRMRGGRKTGVSRGVKRATKKDAVKRESVANGDGPAVNKEESVAKDDTSKTADIVQRFDGAGVDY